jgi:hypothetical protein
MKKHLAYFVILLLTANSEAKIIPVVKLGFLTLLDKTTSDGILMPGVHFGCMYKKNASNNLKGVKIGLEFCNIFIHKSLRKKYSNQMGAKVLFNRQLNNRIELTTSLDYYNWSRVHDIKDAGPGISYCINNYILGVSMGFLYRPIKELRELNFYSKLGFYKYYDLESRSTWPDDYRKCKEPVQFQLDLGFSWIFDLKGR